MNDLLLLTGVDRCSVLQALTRYNFNQNNNNIDFAYHEKFFVPRKISRLGSCLRFRNVHLNGFNTSICFIK